MHAGIWPPKIQFAQILVVRLMGTWGNRKGYVDRNTVLLPLTSPPYSTDTENLKYTAFPRILYRRSWILQNLRNAENLGRLRIAATPKRRRLNAEEVYKTRLNQSTDYGGSPGNGG